MGLRVGDERSTQRNTAWQCEVAGKRSIGAGAEIYGTAAGAGAGDWKSWVKLPSADAESDTPGVEKPFSRGVAGGANAAGSETAGIGRAGIDAVALTNIRVNSPGSWRHAGTTPRGTAPARSSWRRRRAS